MATNFLMFCTSNDGLALALGAGVLGVDWAAGEGRIYTESLGGKGKLSSLCSSTTPFLLSSLLNKGRISSFFSHGQTTAQNLMVQTTPADTAPLPLCHSRTLPLDFLPLDEHVAD